MNSIIIVMPRPEEAGKLRDILSSRGYAGAFVCTTAAAAISRAHESDSGVVICGHRIRDMHYTQLAECLPEYFELLLLATRQELDNSPPGMMALAYPFKPNDLTGTVGLMLEQLRRRLGKKKGQPRKRTEKEQNYINNAKWVLMERNNMSEEEAFRYIQKASMDSGTGMAETAQMILLLIYED